MHTQRDNYSLGSAGLGAGTGAGTIKTQNILHYAIAGRTYAKAVTDNIALAAKGGAAIVALAANQVACLLLFIDAAGTITYRQSKTKTNSTGAGYTPGAFELVPDEADAACFGALKIACNASGAFTPGTTALNATGVTATFYNLGDDYGVPIPF